MALLFSLGAAALVLCAQLAALTIGQAVASRDGATPESAQPLYPLPTQPPYTIAVDPGHGGMDTGASGLVTEVKVCEMTADDLVALLDADPNYRTVRTRENGKDKSNKDRAQVAIDNRAALLLSIHANSDSSRQSHGFECFPTPPGRLYYNESMRFAQCLAAQMETAGHRLRGSGIRYAYYSGHTKKMVPSNDTRVRTLRSFGMVELPACPAVLAEQCFLTNYSDVENWTGKDGCLKAAKVYYRAICSYFGTVPAAAGL